MAQIKLRMAVGANENPNDGMSMGLNAIKQYVEFKTRGEVEVELFWNTLGGSLQVTEQVKNGTLDLALTDDSVLGSFYKPMLAFQIPYLHPSSMAAWAFTDTDIVKQLTEDMRQATGIRTLAFSENGFRNITNNQREVKTPDDMAGLKMRTMQSPVYVELMQAMGASATPIAWPELVPALKTGVVDGQENASTTVLDGMLYEVQQYMSLNEHVFGFHLIIMNEDSFQALSEDHRRIVQEAAKLHAVVANANKVLGGMTAIDALREKGMTIYVNSPSEKAAFRDRTQAAVLAYIASEVGQETVDKVLAAAAEAEARVYGD
jgi:TRAP-type transport system periplasmic protein